MSKPLQGFLTFLLSLVVPTGLLLLLSVLPVWRDLLPPQVVSDLPKVALLVGGTFGFLHGLEAGILCIYDLDTATGWVSLFDDLTWSLPNTMVGFVLGNLIYIFFGNPSRTDSEGKGWISFQPRSSSGFGHSVLQTIGTVNLGGAGQHERMHLLQARVLGPLYIPFVIASYAVTFTLQVVWTLTLGGLLALVGARDKAYLQPPASSAVGGFFGWIYYATPIELFAYATGNP
jgi:hypothetical protein